MRLTVLTTLPLVLTLLGSPALASSYFPVKPGTTWKLSNGEIQKLTTPITLRGVQVTPLQHVVGGRLVSEDLLEVRGGAVLLRGTRIGGKVNWYEPGLTLYPGSPLAVGQAWQSTTGGTTLSVRVMGQEALVTPTGRYNALLLRNEVTTTSGGNSVNYAYFVPGVGTVRYLGANGGSVDLIR